MDDHLKIDCEKLKKSLERKTLLGQGGQARCYRIQYDDVDCAVKEYSIHCQLISSIHRELTVLKLIDSHGCHPHIVKWLGYTEYENKHYFLFKLCQGDIHNSNAKYNEEKQKEIFVQVLSALNFVHSCNGIHRDVKTDNFLFAENGLVLLSDFGLSVVTDGRALQSVNQNGHHFFKNGNELGDGYTSKADIFALGRSMMMLAANYNGESDADSMPQDIEHKLYNKMSKSFKDLIKKLCDADKDKRYGHQDIIKHEWFLSREIKCFHNQKEVESMKLSDLYKLWELKKKGEQSNLHLVSYYFDPEKLHLLDETDKIPLYIVKTVHSYSFDFFQSREQSNIILIDDYEYKRLLLLYESLFSEQRLALNLLPHPSYDSFEPVQILKYLDIAASLEYFGTNSKYYIYNNDLQRREGASLANIQPISSSGVSSTHVLLADNAGKFYSLSIANILSNRMSSINDFPMDRLSATAIQSDIYARLEEYYQSIVKEGLLKATPEMELNQVMPMVGSQFYKPFLIVPYIESVDRVLRTKSIPRKVILKTCSPSQKVRLIENMVDFLYKEDSKYKKLTSKNNMLLYKDDTNCLYPLDFNTQLHRICTVYAIPKDIGSISAKLLAKLVGLYRGLLSNNALLPNNLPTIFHQYFIPKETGREYIKSNIVRYLDTFLSNSNLSKLDRKVKLYIYRNSLLDPEGDISIKDLFYIINDYRNSNQLANEVDSKLLNHLFLASDSSSGTIGKLSLLNSPFTQTKTVYAFKIKRNISLNQDLVAALRQLYEQIRKERVSDLKKILIKEHYDSFLPNDVSDNGLVYYLSLISDLTKLDYSLQNGLNAKKSVFNAKMEQLTLELGNERAFMDQFDKQINDVKERIKLEEQATIYAKLAADQSELENKKKNLNILRTTNDDLKAQKSSKDTDWEMIQKNTDDLTKQEDDEELKKKEKESTSVLEAQEKKIAQLKAELENL